MKTVLVEIKFAYRTTMTCVCEVVRGDVDAIKAQVHRFSTYDEAHRFMVDDERVKMVFDGNALDTITLGEISLKTLDENTWEAQTVRAKAVKS
jgi:hypothetical protein